MSNKNSENGKEVSEFQGNISSTEKKPIIGYRWILVLLGLYVYFLMFFIRNTFSVSLVGMVNSTDSSTDDDLYLKDVCPAALNKTSDGSTDSESNSGEYDWSNSQQSQILSAYFWGYVFSRLFISRIAETMGQRKMVAVMMFLQAVLTAACPVAASIHPMALAGTRFLIGFGHGPMPAALQSLLSIWGPRNELSSMATTMLSG